MAALTVSPPPDDAAGDGIVETVTRLLSEPSTVKLAAFLQSMTPAERASGPGRALAGEIARRGNDHAVAARLLGEAIVATPQLHRAYHALALAHIAAGNRALARAAWQSLLERDADDRYARYQIARSYEDDGEFDLATRWYEAQVERHPRMPAAWYNLGLRRLHQGDPAAALAAFRSAIAANPANANAWIGLGSALRDTGDARGALDAWAQACTVDPKAIEPLRLAAKLRGEQAELPAAIALLERAIAIARDDPSLHWACGSHASNLGQHAKAIAHFRTARALAPHDSRGHSALLLELQYDAALATPDELARAHRDWGREHAPPRPVAMRAARVRSGRLRIGYLSPRFGLGPLATLFLPVLEHHDRARFEVRLYSAHRHDDAIAVRFRAACDGWTDLPADDDAAAEAIAADELDLLVDLAGHSPGHRLAAIARRPAPVQATWLDYFDTTGVDAIDYLIGDPVHTPAAEAAHFSEALVLLPCRFAYRPLMAPAASPPPSLASGHITFGSFNRHAKITPPVLDAWRRVLEQVPGARLALRASAYNGEGTVAWLREQWARAGMPVERIDFHRYVDWQQALDAYASIDVALDPFPYNGGVTTCDALAHGVPVVALRGDRMIARQSAALLHAAGCDAWIAGSVDEYVERAVALARSNALDRIREQLHAGTREAPLQDVAAFARRLEQAFEAMIERGARDRSLPHPPPPIEIA